MGRGSRGGRAAAVVKTLIKSGLTRLGLHEHASRSWIWLEPRLIRALRAVTGRNRRLIGRYLADHPVAKLHIGCGDNELPEWLNTELCPRGSQVYLDATGPFPLPDNCIDLVYSEHMIEHVSWEGGRAMLGECYRVMKPGATLRIVTPDLAFLVRLVENPSTPIHAAYIRYSMEAYQIAAPSASAVHVVNHFMRAWGHQFIYDESTLRRLMNESGFTGITTCRIDESAHPALAAVAKIDRMPEGFLSMESLVLEARKPVDAR